MSITPAPQLANVSTTLDLKLENFSLITMSDILVTAISRNMSMKGTYLAVLMATTNSIVTSHRTSLLFLVSADPDEKEKSTNNTVGT